MGRPGGLVAHPAIRSLYRPVALAPHMSFIVVENLSKQFPGQQRPAGQHPVLLRHGAAEPFAAAGGEKDGVGSGHAAQKLPSRGAPCTLADGGREV